MRLEGFADVSEVLGPGVYVLLRRGIVVYVGKSRKMLARITAHQQVWSAKRSKGEKPWWLSIPGLLFDEVHVMRCRVDQLDEVEREMIARFRPKYNVQLQLPLMLRPRTREPQAPIRRI